MTEHHFAATRTARYYQLGELSAATRRVWFVAHGYGQLAQYFLRHFQAISTADPTLVVVAPEGLSRFYLQGNGGRVGASWMTSDDRLAEIADHCAFLNQLADRVLAQCPAAAQVTALGFSQGTATVGRWLAQARFRPARLVLWAGGFPPDVAPTAATALLHKLPVTLVLGDADEYITPEKMAVEQDRLAGFGAQVAVLKFAGGHTLDAGVLAHVGAGLAPARIGER